MLDLTSQKLIGATINKTKTGANNSLAPTIMKTFKTITDKAKFTICEPTNFDTIIKLIRDLNT